MRIVLALGVLLGGCASAPASNAPAWAVRIMDETHKRVIVEHSDWYARDYRYIPEGQEVWGNCATFAFTAAVLTWKTGRDGKVIQCGRAHVIAVADGWAFDAREYQPISLSAMHCETNGGD